VALFLGIAFAAQLEAVRAGVPAPASADPLMTEGPSDAATAGGALSPNLGPGQQQGAAWSGAGGELCAAAPVAVAQQPRQTRRE
jgi:hypothetical protein